MRLLGCGGRFFSDRETLWRVLDGIASRHTIETTIDGRCPLGGFDLLVQQWSEDRGIPNKGFPMIGSAGPARNSRMLKGGRPTHWIAGAGGSGTADMVRKLKAARIPGD